MSASKKQPIIRRSPIDNLFTSLEEEGVRPYRQVKMIALNRIDPNPLQPRRRTDESAVAELTESIRAHDLQNPINVCLVGDRYVIVSGHMRYEACRRLGRTEIPAVVRTITDEADGLVKALIENVQRTDLDPLDEARSYRELMTLREWSLREVARQVGKSPAHVQGRVSLLNDEAVVAAVERGLPARTAAEIARIPDPVLRHEVLGRAESEKLDITEVVRQIRAAKDPPPDNLAGEETDAPAGVAGPENADPGGPIELPRHDTLVATTADDRPNGHGASVGGEEPDVTGQLSSVQFRWLGRLETLRRSAAALRGELPSGLADIDRTAAIEKVAAALESLEELHNALTAQSEAREVH